MEGLSIHEIFESLSRAYWEVAHRTYGSSHATLIGVMVEWWVSLSLEAHTALEGPPSPGQGNANQGDAVLCRNEMPVGILEVEGTRPVEKVETICKYLGSKKPGLSSLNFGLLFAYSYEPSGIRHRHAENRSLIDAVEQATIRHPGRSLILVEADKTYSRFASGIRTSNAYLAGTIDSAFGIIGGIWILEAADMDEALS